MQNSRLRSYVSRDRKERSIRLANQWDTDSGIWYRQFPQGMRDFWSRNFIIVRHILVQLHRFSPANELSISAVTPFAAHGLSRVQPRDSRLYNLDYTTQLVVVTSHCCRNSAKSGHCAWMSTDKASLVAHREKADAWRGWSSGGHQSGYSLVLTDT